MLVILSQFALPPLVSSIPPSPSPPPPRARILLPAFACVLTETQRTGEYEFDPITEYMIKVGRQDARLDVAWDFYAKYTLPK